MGKPGPESLLVRGMLQLQSGQVAGAQKTIAAAHAARIQDARLLLLEAKILLAAKGAPAADEALRLLDEAATRYPGDVAVARERVDLVLAFEKWQAASRAVEGYKRALYQTQGHAVEAHVVDARIRPASGACPPRSANTASRWPIQAWNVSLWIEFGRAAEGGGRDAVAREAYREAARLSPNSPEVSEGLRRAR